LLNVPLEFTSGHWSLDARRTSAQENFGRQLGMLACESSKAPTTLSRLLEVINWFPTPETPPGGTLVHLSPGEKGRNEAFNPLQRITAYLFSTVLKSSSNLQKICSQTAFHAYLDDISVQRAATANLRTDLSWSGETHSFGRTAVQSHPQVSSDVLESHFDPKPADSEAGPVPALEAVEASGRFARALQ
jgi:hypothetical protein